MASRPSRLFTRGLLALLLACTAGMLWIYGSIYGPGKMFGDFAVFHEAARHALAHDWQAVYGTKKLRALLDAHSQERLLFFLNPPPALMFVYPLGFFGAAAALLLWFGAQIAALALALRTRYMRRLFATPSPEDVCTPSLLAIVFAAFSLQNFLFGQTALFCAALFLAVIALRHSRPLLAGMALGLFSLKPQLGILLPVLLLMERNWQTLATAVLTAMTLIILSFALFPAGLWDDYRQTLVILQAFLERPQPALFALTTSPYAALRNLGLEAAPAYATQCALSLGVLFLLCTTLRKLEEKHKILLLILATYLVSPYSLVYDTALLAIPCALLLRQTEADKATLPQLLALLLLIALPLAGIVLQIAHIPYSVVAIGSAFGVARLAVNNPKGG